MARFHRPIGRSICSGFILSTWLCSLQACAQTSSVTPTQIALPPQAAFQLQGDTVTLQFDPQKYGTNDIRSVMVRGTFTSWSKSSLPLTKGSDGVWRVTRTRAQVDIPGNSGQPEFKFVINDSQWIGAEKEAPGFRFTGNFVLLFDGDSPADIALRDEKASVVRDNYDSTNQLANFRELLGGNLRRGILFRSYHPFIASRPELKSEAPRLLAVQALTRESGIKAVLNMADSLSDVQGPTVPDVYNEIVLNGNVLINATSYEDSYFQPEGPGYAKTLQKAFGFIASHPGPYLIHCRLGTDRTGVLSAVIEAFMGVPWTTIAADFDKSNEMGIREYRHPGLLAFAFRRMLGQSPTEIEDLSAATRNFLLKQGVNSETLDAAALQLAASASLD